MHVHDVYRRMRDGLQSAIVCVTERVFCACAHVCKLALYIIDRSLTFVGVMRVHVGYCLGM